MRCAVLGSPIRHSLSPVLHRAAYAELGLAWTYEAAEVPEADLAGFVEGLDGTWRGLSLTMPLKRTVIDLLDDQDPLVRATGVANTVVLEDGRRLGYNTDIPGSVNAIRERSSASVTSAIILGGGATAASLGWALADLGCGELLLFVRNPATVAETVDVIKRHPSAPRVELGTFADLGEARSADVIASTIPVDAQTPDLTQSLTHSGAGVVFDVIYDPWPTPLAMWAAADGRTLVNGLDLLCHQAALQVELMTGQLPSVAIMREAGLTALAARDRDSE
jgi:shikimate dehydrogenase